MKAEPLLFNGNKAFLFFILLACLFTSCQKKDLDLEFKQKECVKLRINTPNYERIIDPSCNTGTDSAVFKIVFKHPSQKDCIDKISLSPDFFDKNQNKISPVAFHSELLISNPDVAVYNDSATFILRAKFSDPQAASRFNNLYLKFNTENKLGDKSKDTELRINGRCSEVLSQFYSVKDTFEVNSRFVKVTFYDDASEDGDVISVYLNGIWVIENFSLTNKGDTFEFEVRPGYNDLVLFAVNEGKVGPNTCAVSINGSDKITLKQDLKTGEAISINFR